MKKPLSFYVLICAIAALLLGAGAYYYVVRAHAKPAVSSYLYTGPVGAYAELVKTNAHYASAQTALAGGDYKTALAEFQLALTSATNSAQVGQIRFDIANSTNLNGDPLSAVALFKEVAQNENNVPILRAYAVEYIGRIYYGTQDSRVTDEIFKDGAFAALRDQNDVALSYRHLFEYGSHLYPLAMSEIFIANWYADTLRSASSSISAETRQSYLSLVHAKLSGIDKEVARMSRSTSNETPSIPEVVFDKANLLARLTGVDSAISATDVENAYIQAMNAYGTTSNVRSEFYVRLYYAAFLARTYPGKRASDIENLLAPLYQELSDIHSSHARYLLNNRNPSATRHADVLLLGKADPQFKSALILLGWHEEDFTISAGK